MIPIKARGIYIKSEAYADPRSRARIEKMLPLIRSNQPPQVIDDAALEQLVIAESLNEMPLHGRDFDTIEPVVIFNQFLYHHSEEERLERKRRFPELFRFCGTHDPYSGYSGWDWRKEGDGTYLEDTGLVCQPGHTIHSFWGCHFRCVYCNLGHVANIYVNLEDWAEHIQEGLGNLEKYPGQNLFQWDNGTDMVCWEPEYGGTKILVDLFANQPDKYLELYVGKSDIVDFMLDYDHKGHTICCWSLGSETQCRLIEPRSASMEARLLAARKCQEAGYTVRIRLSPMVPVIGWEEEMRHMLARMFDEITPDLITMEPLRFCTHERLLNDFPADSIDPDFLRAIGEVRSDDWWEMSQFPDDYRVKMYRLVLDEVARRSPHTPVALCREKLHVWEALADDFKRMGQSPDDYVCNCGPVSAGCDPRLRAVIND